MNTNLFRFFHIHHLDVGVNNEVSSRSPTDDVLANNVEHFGGKDRKIHHFGGPSEGGGAFGPREIINRQVIFVIFVINKSLISRNYPIIF